MAFGIMIKRLGLHVDDFGIPYSSNAYSVQLCNHCIKQMSLYKISKENVEAVLTQGTQDFTHTGGIKYSRNGLSVITNEPLSHLRTVTAITVYPY